MVATCCQLYSSIPRCTPRKHSLFDYNAFLPSRIRLPSSSRSPPGCRIRLPSSNKVVSFMHRLPCKVDSPVQRGEIEIPVQHVKNLLHESRRYPPTFMTPIVRPDEFPGQAPLPCGHAVVIDVEICKPDCLLQQIDAVCWVFAVDVHLPLVVRVVDAVSSRIFATRRAIWGGAGRGGGPCRFRCFGKLQGSFGVAGRGQSSAQSPVVDLPPLS